MGVGDLLGDVGVKVPEGIGAGAGNFVWGFIFFIVLTTVVIGIFIFVSNRRSYNKQIHMFEEIAGKANPVGIDTAREIILPFTSIRAFQLKQRKIYLPRPISIIKI